MVDPWDEDTCQNAAQYGRLDCLRYAHENDCPWDETTCRYAAEFGHLDVFYSMRMRMVVLGNENTCLYAVKYGKFRLFTLCA